MFGRSQCPKCKARIAWYDLIPVLSWIILGRKCRRCRQPISWLYPAIEILTALVFVFLWHQVPTVYLPAYALLCSALIVTIRSDLETMLISRFVTLFLIPVGIALSFLGLLPLTPMASIGGALFGYFILWSTGKIFKKLTHKEGIGQGDLELLAFIGSFTGIIGCWLTLLIGSVTGSIIGLTYLVATGQKTSAKIPFGPFLALGAIIFVLFGQELTFWFLGGW